jgi:hypothetical protein
MEFPILGLGEALRSNPPILFVVLLLIWMMLLGFSCQENRNSSPENVEVGIITQPDGIVESRIITDEIAGSVYRRRATEFFLVMGSDSSSFKPIISESISGELALYMNYSGSEKNLLWSRRMKELELILERAGDDYNLGSLEIISMGRLVFSGDLAIGITKELENSYPDRKEIRAAGYTMLCEFLLNSRLAKDFNELLFPYSLKVKSVSIEKNYFLPKKFLVEGSHLETETSSIPNKILDCITWLKIQKL